MLTQDQIYFGFQVAWYLIAIGVTCAAILYAPTLWRDVKDIFRRGKDAKNIKLI
jgi:hypothetical protein